jgi:hypothetical protein
VRQVVAQSRLELEQHLRDQFDFLRSSASLFDAGHTAEAKRLAVSVRLLVHDTRVSSSLLGQLGLKSILFYDTASDHNPMNLITHSGLASLAVSPQGARYQAMLDHSPRGPGIAVGFHQWWAKTVIVDVDRNVLTRRDLVLAVSNQDGGAHVDPDLAPTYAKLSRANSLAWAFRGPDGAVPLDNPVPASIRQIAHELTKTLEPHLPTGA